MSLIPAHVTPEKLQSLMANNMIAHVGIEFTEVGPDYVCARMPVDARTHQPMGLLHGGASVVLAETLGSAAANCCVDQARQYCVGLEVNANHLRGVRSGYVTGKTTPVHVGKRTQVWEIRITDDAGQLVCISRLTMAVLDRA